MNPCPKPKVVKDDKYKYWLVKNGTDVLKAFPELRKVIPLDFYWGEAVNHHVSCDKHRDDHQVRCLSGVHSWFHLKGGRWEKEHVDELRTFARSQYRDYKREVCKELIQGEKDD